MKAPLVATPCYGNMLCVNYVQSITSLNPVPDLFLPSGSLITAIRNKCVERFMGGEWTHLFFIDADIGFAPSSFRRLLCSGYDVAASPYPYKTDEDTGQGGFVVDIDEMGEVGPDGFATIDNAPTGFMCISRDALTKMANAGVKENEYFDTMRDGEEYLAEDHAFCRRWLDIGGTIHLDTCAELTHQGAKTYRRDFKQYRNENG